MGSAVLVAALFVVLDSVRPVEKQWITRGLLVGIDLYQATLSKAMPKLGVQCRFQPTCSHYGEAVVRQHGAIRGGAKAVRRILRCGPWSEEGTYDPPGDPPGVE